MRRDIAGWIADVEAALDGTRDPAEMLELMELLSVLSRLRDDVSNDAED